MCCCQARRVDQGARRWVGAAGASGSSDRPCGTARRARGRRRFWAVDRRAGIGAAEVIILFMITGSGSRTGSCAAAGPEVLINAGSGSRAPGAGRREPGVGSRESGSGVGVGSRESGVGSRESGVGSRESGVGSRESGVGSRESGVGSGSREPGAGSREPGAGSREPGAGSRGRSREPGAGSRADAFPSHGAPGCPGCWLPGDHGFGARNRVPRRRRSRSGDHQRRVVGRPERRVDQPGTAPVALPRGDIGHVLCRGERRWRAHGCRSSGAILTRPAGRRVPGSARRNAQRRPSDPRSWPLGAFAARIGSVHARPAEAARRGAAPAARCGGGGGGGPGRAGNRGSGPPEAAEAALTPAADQGVGRAILNREHSSIYSRGPRGQFSRDPRDGLLAPQRRHRRARRPRQDHPRRRHAPRLGRVR